MTADGWWPRPPATATNSNIHNNNYSSSSRVLRTMTFLGISGARSVTAAFCRYPLSTVLTVDLIHSNCQCQPGVLSAPRECFRHTPDGVQISTLPLQLLGCCRTGLPLLLCPGRIFLELGTKIRFPLQIILRTVAGHCKHRDTRTQVRVKTKTLI